VSAVPLEFESAAAVALAGCVGAATPSTPADAGDVMFGKDCFFFFGINSDEIGLIQLKKVGYLCCRTLSLELPFESWDLGD
jgi:hypothetical protein